MKVLVLIPAAADSKNVVRDLLYGALCGGRRIGGAQMPPLQLIYLATVLKESGHQARLIDASADYSAYQRIKKRIKNFSAVVIPTSSQTFHLDVASLVELKTLNPGIKTIVFGAHPTFMPRYCLAEKSIDFIIRREPEFVVRDLINALDKHRSTKKILGIGFREKNKIVLNNFYPFLDKLDDLPLPDRSLLPQNLDYFNPLVKKTPYATVQTSRGCPAKCNFCTAPSFYGHRFRTQSAEKVLADLSLIKKQGYKEVIFRDETFTAFPSRLEKICLGMIKQGLNLSWLCNSRVDTISLPMMRLMKQAGCHMIKFGVESGVARILKNIGKNTSLKQARITFQNAHQAGIDTHAHLMLGCPGESLKTIQTTIDFVKEIDPLTATFGIQTPYPGTLLFKSVAKSHPEIKDGSACDLKKLHIKGFFNQSFTRLTSEELEESVRRAYRQFYLRPGYLLRWLKRFSSWAEVKRVIMAGVMIFAFSFRGEE